MPDLPPIPSPPRKSRGWFHPLRWRFCCLTAPVLFWTTLAVLFWWPGLSYNWRVGNWFYLYRARAKSSADIASLKMGPVILIKREGDPRTPARGFVIEDGVFQFFWDGGMLLVFHE